MPVKVYISNISVLFAVLALPLFTIAQNKPAVLPTNASHQIEYIENVAVPNTDQSLLFRRALSWVVTSRSYKFKKVDLMDNGYGRIMAQGKFLFYPDEVFIQLSVDVKNNKAQLKVSRFDYNMQMGNIALDNLTNTKSKVARTLIPQVSESMKAMIKSFREAMLSAAKI